MLYVRKEAQAFNSWRGIWSNLDSRNAYLKRLRDEEKTVYSLKNPLFRAEPRESLNLKPAQYKGFFLRVRGVVVKTRNLSRGAQLIFLKCRNLKQGLPVITFKEQRKENRLEQSCRGTPIQVEDFVQLYRGKQWQIRMHRGMVLD